MNQKSTAEIQDADFAEALGQRYLSYALSTIVSRSMPDVRDGMKPVHRRLLYAMRELRLDPASGYKKSARVVGDVIGKFHPHGDQSVYDALVRLAQEFAQRYPLVDGQGNFGNVDGDNAAAMRYTEARLTEVAQLLMEGIDEDAVDLRPTYDGEEEEPVVLPAAFPNLLANGSTGIAVSMSTSIPPHNVAEICAALLHLIEHPNASINTLAQKIPGPDFPTGGVLVESHDQIVEAYRTGRGGFRVRARWEVERIKGGGYRIIVTEIPYQVQKAQLVEQIAELMAARKLALLGDVRDESTEDVRLVLEPKSRNVDPEILMESLFRATRLENKFSLLMNVLAPDQTPRVLDLHEVLQAFLDHRRAVLQRRTNHRLAKIAKRLEVLAGYLVAYLNLDEVIRIVREEDEPKPALIDRFALSEAQAEAILNMRLRALRKLEEMEIRSEHAELIEEQARLSALMGDEAGQWAMIAGDIKALKKKFGPNTPLGRRRTELADAPVVVPLEAVIEREPVTVLCSEQGWIRAVRGHLENPSEAKYKTGDGPRFLVRAETTDRLLIFAGNGRFYTVVIDKLPRGRGHGEPIRLSIDLPNDKDLISMTLATVEPSDDPCARLLIASRGGRGFMVVERDALAQTRAGKQVLALPDGDAALICRPVAEGHDHAAVLGENRKLLVFPLSELPVMTRGQGVLLQRYKKGALLEAGLADMTTFALADGLPFAQGDRVRRVTELDEYLGKRAAAGKRLEKGVRHATRFAE